MKNKNQMRDELAKFFTENKTVHAQLVLQMKKKVEFAMVRSINDGKKRKVKRMNIMMKYYLW